MGFGAFLREPVKHVRVLYYGFAHRAYVDQLEIVDPISPSRWGLEHRVLVRPIERVVAPELPILYASVAYDQSRVITSKINSSQAIDNANLIAPKVNEESRVESPDGTLYNYG